MTAALDTGSSIPRERAGAGKLTLMRAARPLLPAVLAALLTSCTYTFLPLVPEKVKAEPRLVTTGETRLERQDDGLVLVVRLSRVPSEGYLSAFLYRDDVKLGEDSRLIGPGSTEASFRFPGAQVGEYRAMLFWGGETLRQLELAVR